MQDRLFQQVIEDYAELEPGEGDTWNPLYCDVELLHRVELLKHLAWALRASGVDPAGIDVLDLGCGNGRSTRMYLDLGMRPEQLTGIDLRPGAIARAQGSHSSIRYLHYGGERIPLDGAAVDWVSLCTVISSVREPAARRHIADEIWRVLRPGGFLFFWDLLVANDFAGSDPLRPAQLFPRFEPVWAKTTTVDGFVARERGYGRGRRLLSALAARLLARPTHNGCLLRRPNHPA